MLEAATTSLQIHIQVGAAEAARAARDRLLHLLLSRGLAEEADVVAALAEQRSPEVAKR